MPDSRTDPERDARHDELVDRLAGPSGWRAWQQLYEIGAPALPAIRGATRGFAPRAHLYRHKGRTHTIIALDLTQG